MLALALHSLRRRKVAVLGGLLALFCAGALVCSCGVLLETGIHGSVAPQRYAGTPTVVTADQQIHWTKVKHKHGKTKRKTKSKALAERAWLSPSVGAELRRIDGATVVPDRTFPAELRTGTGRFVSGINGRSLGHNWSSARLTPYRLTSGHAPTRAQQIVVDDGLARAAHLRPGSRVVVQSTAAPATYVVAGVAAPRTAVTAQSAIFFHDPEARALAGHGGAVAAYGVFGVGAHQVQRALERTTAQVSTGTDRGTAEFPEAAAARARLVSMGGAMGGTALIVAALVVAGIFSLSVQQRHRELALLRAVGATPRQVRRLIGREALLLALAGGVPGAICGLPIAELVREQFVSSGTVPNTVTLTRGPLPVAAGMLTTVAAALVAARLSARRIARVHPADALAESTVERRAIGVTRGAAGAVCTAAAVTVTVLLTHLHTEPAAVPVTYLAVLLWLIAVAVLGPLLVRVVAAALGTPARVSPLGARLAVQHANSRSRRVAAVLTPLALLVGMTSTILFVPATLSSAAQAQVRSGLHADHVVTSTGPGVPLSAVDRLRHTDGVTAAVPVVRSTLWAGQDKRSVQGVGTDALAAVLDPQVVSGSLSALRPGTIAMSDRAAQGRTVGATVRVTLGDGTVASYRLVAIYGRGLGFGDTLLPFATLSRHVDDPLAAEVLVRGTAAPAQLRHAVPGLRVNDRSDHLQAVGDGDRQNAGVEFVFLVLVVLFSSIAAVNTLVIATMDRSREFSLVRIIGATKRQVRGWLRWEVALLLVLAAGAGALAAWATLTGFSVGMIGASRPAVRGGAMLLILLAAAGICAAGTFLPARILLRRNVAHEVGEGPG